MNRGIVTIDDTGTVFVPVIPVWMTKFEIADLFGVFSSDIRKIIHSVYKNHELDEQTTMRYIKSDARTSMDIYSLEMIVNIAFRLCSRESLVFRQYVLKKLQSGNKGIGCLLFGINGMKEKDRDLFILN